MGGGGSNHAAIDMGGVSQEQKILKGHLPRVIYHRVYSAHEDKSWGGAAGARHARPQRRLRQVRFPTFQALSPKTFYALSPKIFPALSPKIFWAL